MRSQITSMNVIASSSSVRVYPGRWMETRSAVRGQLDYPVALVNSRMVIAAEEHAVSQIGRTAVDPVPNVVAVAPRHRPIAARERAAVAVTQTERPALGGGEGTGRPAEVERLTVATEHGG